MRSVPSKCELVVGKGQCSPQSIDQMVIHEPVAAGDLGKHPDPLQTSLQPCSWWNSSSIHRCNKISWPCVPLSMWLGLEVSNPVTYSTYNVMLVCVCSNGQCYSDCLFKPGMLILRDKWTDAKHRIKVFAMAWTDRYWLRPKRNGRWSEKAHKFSWCERRGHKPLCRMEAYDFTVATQKALKRLHSEWSSHLYQ